MGGSTLDVRSLVPVVVIHSLVSTAPCGSCVPCAVYDQALTTDHCLVLRSYSSAHSELRHESLPNTRLVGNEVDPGRANGGIDSSIMTDTTP